MNEYIVIIKFKNSEGKEERREITVRSNTMEGATTTVKKAYGQFEIISTITHFRRTLSNDNK